MPADCLAVLNEVRFFSPFKCSVRQRDSPEVRRAAGQRVAQPKAGKEPPPEEQLQAPTTIDAALQLVKTNISEEAFTTLNKLNTAEEAKISALSDSKLKAFIEGVCPVLPRPFRCERTL